MCGGYNAMVEVAEIVSDCIASFAWWKNSDLRELDLCWHGIGNWHAQFRD
jgi:hypothetical protein